MAINVETFKKLYLHQFDVVLSDEEAERKAQSLMKLYKAVYGSPELKNNYGNNDTKD